MALASVVTPEERFASLTRCAQACSLCRGMRGRTKVLSTDNGDIRSKVLFVGEAPGRLGADRTAIPLSGDKAGANFEALLANTGWDRAQVFITNAVLCNPRDRQGNNRTPSGDQLFNCAPFLRMTIDVVDPDVVAPLGAVALKALAMLSPHRYVLKDVVGHLLPWAGRHLVPLYHPGQRAAVHRSLISQRADYYRLARLVHPVRGLKPQKRKAKPQLLLKPGARDWALAQSVQFLVSSLGRITMFKLAKLLYLGDLRALTDHGRSITGCTYLRQLDGPWPPRLWPALQQMEGHEILLSHRGRQPLISAGPSRRHAIKLDPSDIDILLDALARYGQLSNSQIKTKTYLTPPMRDVLRRERAGENMLNKVVLSTGL